MLSDQNFQPCVTFYLPSWCSFLKVICALKDWNSSPRLSFMYMKLVKEIDHRRSWLSLHKILPAWERGEQPQRAAEVSLVSLHDQAQKRTVLTANSHSSSKRCNTITSVKVKAHFLLETMWGRKPSADADSCGGCHFGPGALDQAAHCESMNRNGLYFEREKTKTSEFLIEIMLILALLFSYQFFCTHLSFPWTTNHGTFYFLLLIC